MLEGLPHFWINRAADEGRRLLAREAFERAGVVHARIEAVTPDTLPTVKVREPFANSLSELAIVASHLRAAGAALDAGAAAAVIMEDDVRAHHRYDGAALLASAPPDWEILQLHVSHASVIGELGELYLRHGILWHEWEPSCYSAGAWVARRGALASLLARYSPDGVGLDLSGVHAWGKLVADHLLYRRTACYTATVPYFFNDIGLDSTHAPQRDATHHRPGALAAQGLRQRILAARGAYPFALDQR
ncbi:hypothetical protein ACFOHT_25350 [Massilia oculi]|jgi:hypothetical protein|uniref:Glycosyl transferase n=1 Tax=Massilia oculi TaxID=945844 RepID=A0A2S2DNQ1_9BURK|nr:hypothetical protein [Massilia oculi]AWL06931.1 hypothetical protein DIR46_22520 [Massilia oculi]